MHSSFIIIIFFSNFNFLKWCPFFDDIVPSPWKISKKYFATFDFFCKNEPCAKCTYMLKRYNRKLPWGPLRYIFNSNCFRVPTDPPMLSGSGLASTICAGPAEPGGKGAIWPPPPFGRIRWRLLNQIPPPKFVDLPPCLMWWASLRSLACIPFSQLPLFHLGCNVL